MDLPSGAVVVPISQPVMMRLATGVPPLPAIAMAHDGSSMWYLLLGNSVDMMAPSWTPESEIASAFVRS